MRRLLWTVGLLAIPLLILIAWKLKMFSPELRPISTQTSTLLIPTTNEQGVKSVKATGASGSRAEHELTAAQPERGPEALAMRKATPELIVLDSTVPQTDSERGHHPKDLTPDEILRFMRENYAALSSYTDKGRKSTTWHDLNKVYQDDPFRSFFKRPLYYRFEWLGDAAPYSQGYWSNNNGVFDRKNVGGAPRYFGDLGSMFRVVMVEPAYDVLQFLLPDTVPAFPDFFVATDRLADEDADGVSCYHLQGITPGTRRHRELWIGSTDGLLRRVLTVSQHNYAASKTPVYKTGSETQIWDYLEVSADIDLPSELFYPLSR